MVHPQIIVHPRIIVTKVSTNLSTKLIVLRSIIRGNTVVIGVVVQTHVRSKSTATCVIVVSYTRIKGHSEAITSAKLEKTET